ncbi:MAG TPA: hypothetical protein VNZ43_08230 [Sphingomonadaceae bacterium]|nr:hypothetical protein [Sphingomonadaceae bacterium]
MQFLRTLFWVVAAVVAVAFSYNNWKTVQFSLWGGLVAEVNLPLLIFGAFLVGLVPLYIVHRAALWRLRRRLEVAERALAELRGVDEALPPSIAADAALPSTPLPPVAS